MRRLNMLAAVLRRLAALRREPSGNVAIMFSLALVPIVGVVGAAVDYGNAVNIRSKLQVAADAAAISGDLVTPWSEAQCTSVARGRLLSGMAANAITPSGEPSIECSASGTQVSVRSEISTYILGAVSTDLIDVSVVAETRCTVSQEVEQSLVTGPDVMVYMPFFRDPNQARINTMGEAGHEDIHGHPRNNPTHPITPDGWPIVRLENPHPGPATITVRQNSGPNQMTHTYHVPGRGFWLTTWPQVNVLENPTVLVFNVVDATANFNSGPRDTHGHTYRFLNLGELAPTTPDADVQEVSA